MKGDFSRIRLSKKHEREKNYRKVLFQQGRVLTDSDVNAYVEMVDQQNIKSLRDIIGKNGVPLEQKESFEIKPIPGSNRYNIGKGRMYVDGILVENFREVQGFSDEIGSVLEQPYLPSVFVDSQPMSDAVPKEPGIYLAFLVVYDRHITALDDSDLQESALGDSDTSTSVQTVWQVKLHKLQDEDIPEDPTEENKWAPWIKLDNDTENESVRNIRIGRNNDGTLLEAFTNTRSLVGKRKSIRQESLNPVVKWESRWDVSNEEIDNYSEFDIASRHVGDVEILHTFGIHKIDNSLHYRVRKSKDDRWDKEDAAPKALPTGSQPFNPKLVINDNGNIEAFVISSNIIHHSKKHESSLWEDWIQIGQNQGNLFTSLSLILPKDGRIEIYAISRQLDRIWYTKQNSPDSSDWNRWEVINLERQQDDPQNFTQCIVGLNQFNEVVIFVRDNVQAKVWVTKRTDLHPHGNGWQAVGDNQPGRLIRVDSLTVQNNPKKLNRLELFGIFSDDENNDRSGKIWNIFEDKNGEWNSKWKIINEILDVNEVVSTTDRKSRVNLFVKETISNFGNLIHHSYIEDLLNCEMEIQSWKSKIKPSQIQLKARTRPQNPLPDDPCLLPEQAGYRRLENQLYRIEIHDPPNLENNNTTFKFSRDNGTVCSKILNISDNKITVASLGRDKLLRFSSNQTVEITDNMHTLWGVPGFLSRIIDIEGTDLILDRNIDDDSFSQGFNPIVRRWDSAGALEVKEASEDNGWIEIEDGIQVKFKNIDNCRTGDHWTIAARTSKADIEWPKREGIPEFVDIEGIEYHYTKLALLEYIQDKKLEVISDCRTFFPPLNTLSSPSNAQSMIYWIHGTVSEVEFPERVFLKQGIEHGHKHGTGSSYYQDDPDHDFNWFHFPITISFPASQQKKISLQEIYILFESNNGAEIIQLDIYDGGRKIYSLGLSLSGDHGKSPNKFNTFKFEPEIMITQGIGISIKAKFRGTEDIPEIHFRSIGIRFL